MPNFWDDRFAGEDYVYGTQPNAFLVEQSGRLAPGSRLLVPGDGEGRNGVWLAGLGMSVFSVDGSTVGLAKAERLATTRGVAIATEVADLVAWTWPRDTFDAVVSLFLHLSPPHRVRVHARMVEALRPGGLIILEAFRPEQLAYSSGGPKDPAMLYTAEQLTADFRGSEILLLDQPFIDLDEGPLHRGPAATIRLVARKPGS